MNAENNITNKNSNKKKLFVLGAFAIIVGLVVGISYAYWTRTVTQQSLNKITTDCLQIEIADVTDAISLKKAYPLRDTEAESLEPYTFKLTNICNKEANYNINLEVLEVTNQLDNNYVAISFNGGAKEILGNKIEVTPTYDENGIKANNAYFLENGTLAAGASQEYTLKLWVDESVTSNDAMNKSFKSKISVTAGEVEEPKVFAKQVELGDYISMTPISTNYDDSTQETGHFDINPSELNLWRVINIKDNGEIEIVSEYVSSKEITFYGQPGYVGLVGILNKVASQYENSFYTISGKSRNIGYNNQTNTLTEDYYGDFLKSNIFETSTDVHENQYEIRGGGDNLYQQDINLLNNANVSLKAKKVGTSSYGAYWLASRSYLYYSASSYGWVGRTVEEDGTVSSIAKLYSYSWLFDSSGNYSDYNSFSSSRSIRPIVTLKPGLTATGSGKSVNDPWVLD